ncbi:MAG: Precorrin-6B methylase 2-like protein [Proteobacteria bacterium]|nr:Precorrin-6B methylase 2-like protein [Pseudomonadota bacterium]
MEPSIFTNDVILAWLRYFAEHVDISLADVRMLDITGRNKNLIPAVMSNRVVLVFTDAGHPDMFYDMWTDDLGNCDVWYNEGSNPTGPMKHDKLSDMIDRGINASAAMLIVNPNAATKTPVGIENTRFSAGSVNYVCREVRAVIMNKLNIGDRDNICVISGESIAVEAALIACEGSVVAVEYDHHDRDTMEENIAKFGLANVTIVESLKDGLPADVPAPDIAFIVASPRIEDEIKSLLALNPAMRFVFYSLDFEIMTGLPAMIRRNGLERTEAIQIAVSWVNSKNISESYPAPWLISAQKME